MMDCRDVQRRLYAFVDEELGASEKDAVQAHVRECPACAARVRGERGLKSAVARAYADERAPAHVYDAVRAALRCDAAGPEPAIFRISRWTRRGRTFALAASIVLVAGVAIWFSRSPAGATTLISDRSEAATTFAAGVQGVHLRCVSAGAAHHHDGLPHERTALAVAMAASLQHAVLAPDLGADRMSVLGAEYCPLFGHPTAHLVYTCAHNVNKPISIFSAASLPELAPIKTRRYERHDYAIVEADRTRTVAWTADGVSYVTCGECSADHLLHVAEMSRGAIAQRGHGEPMLASTHVR